MSRSRRVVVLGLAAAFTGCMFLTKFDPEGQPCDTSLSYELQCLSDAGYWCVGGKCTRDAGFIDAGSTDAGDGG